MTLNQPGRPLTVQRRFVAHAKQYPMELAIRRRAIVEPGGRITIQPDDLPHGAETDVIVPITWREPLPDYPSMLGSGSGTFATAEEADRFIRRERDGWDRS